MNLRGDYGGLGCCALEVRGFGDERGLALRVQVPDNHILSQILTYRYLLSATKVPYYWVNPRTSSDPELSAAALSAAVVA